MEFLSQGFVGMELSSPRPPLLPESPFPATSPSGTKAHGIQELTRFPRQLTGQVPPSSF